LRKLSIFTIAIMLLSGWLDGFNLPIVHAADEMEQVYDVDYMGIYTFEGELRKQEETTSFGSYNSSRLAFKFPIHKDKPIASVVLGFVSGIKDGASFRISVASSDSWTAATAATGFPGVLPGSEKLFTIPEFVEMAYTEVDITSLITPSAISAGGDPDTVSLILYEGDTANQLVTIDNRFFNEVGSPYLKITYDTTPPALVSSTLAADNSYVDLTFSEGVYRNISGTVGLNASSLRIADFASNGGSAASVGIVSVKRNNDTRQAYASDLTGGETTVRVFLNVLGTPSGVESFRIQPANEFSIYDRVGNASPAALTTGAKTLQDKAPPILAGAIRDNDTRIIVQLNENAAASGLNKANNGGFTVEETGNPSLAYAVTGIAPGSDAQHAILTVENMGRSGKEGVTVKYTAGSNGTITDTAGNAMVTDTTGRSIASWDTAAPTLSSSSALAAANAYVDLTFSEGVYGNAAATGGLSTASLQIADFAANGGTAAGVSITAIKAADQPTAASASALSGGETTVRVFLQIMGVASGLETFEVRPGSAASIYDLAGNAAAAALTTGAKTLRDATPPVLFDAVRNSNTQITLELSKNADAATITKSGHGGFTVEETSNDSVSYPVTGIAPGSDSRHIVLTVADMSLSSEEGVTVKYTAGGSGTVADAAGNAMATNTTGVSIPAWDATAPTLTEAVRNSDTQITVALSEDIKADSVTKHNDGGFRVTENGDNSVTYSIVEISPGSDAGHVVLTVSSMGRSGKEGLAVTYAAGGNGTVQDIAGNRLESDTAGQIIAAWDNEAPALNGVDVLEEANTYIDLTFSEGVYGSDDGNVGLDVSNLQITGFTSNGGSATNVAIAAVKRTDHPAAADAAALTGGETAVRVFLTVTGTPSGIEQFQIGPADDNAIYDLAGNEALASLTTGTLTLHDLLPPELVSVVRDSATQLTVELSEAVTDTGATQPGNGGFVVHESGNPAITYAVTEIARGSDAQHVVLTAANLERSAKEGVTVTYTAGGNGLIADPVGNAMVTDGTGVLVAPWDTTPPAIVSAELSSNNAYIDVTFSEGVYGDADGSQPLQAAQLHLILEQNGGGVTAISVGAVTRDDAESSAEASLLEGGETVVRVFLQATGTPYGVEKIMVAPMNGSSVYDFAGNSSAEESGSEPIKLFNQRSYSSGPVKEDGIITVNGVKQEKLGSYRIETMNGEKSTTVQVNEPLMINKLAEFGKGAVITFLVTNGSGRVVVELTAPTLKAMENNGVLLVLETEKTISRIPADQIGVSDILTSLGAETSPEEASILIGVRKTAEPAAADSSGITEIAGTTFDFTIEGVYGAKRANLPLFSRFVERAIALPAGYGPDQVTTGAAVDTDGTLLHVPTRFEKIGDQYFAIMSSLSSSTHKLIRYEKTFSDIRNHWARMSVENMASRLILSGVSDSEFRPNQAVTRAEFLAIAVRALGLRHAEQQVGFKDVPEKQWYAEAVQIGVSNGLLSGYADGTFRPEQAITREEALVILSRILPLVELTSQLEPEKQDNTLAAFHDLNQLSNWARSAAALAINNGLMQGYEDELLPKNNITRAETATLIERLLKEAHFI
jgi:S-layer homology domain.